MSHNRSPLALLVGAAVATGSLAAGTLFSMEAMAHGYLQDAGKPAATEGKCGEGKCGAGMMTDADKPAAKAGQEGRCGMARMDTDKDGRISRAEFAAAHGGKDAMFAKIDSDGDGFISQAEMDAHHAAMQKANGEGKCGEGKCGEGKCGGRM